MSKFKKLLAILDVYERKRLRILTFMILIMAFLDMLGVASILPFMTVLTNPSIIETNSFLNKFYQFSNVFGVNNYDHFFLILGFVVLLLLISSLVFKAITTFVQLRFIQMCEFSISKRLVEGYLNQPYSWFLNRNSSDLGKSILSEVQQVISSGITPLISLISRGVVSFALIVLLILTDPNLASIIGFSFAALYGFIFFLVRKYLARIGKIRLENNEIRFKSISEAFGAIKDIKFGSLEKTYLNRFSNAAQNLAKSQATASIISQLPRFFLEAIAFGGIILILLYIIAKEGSFSNALPVVSLYAFAGYRLMPALQQMYSSFSLLTFVGPALNKLHEDISEIKPLKLNEDKNIIKLNKSINLNNINFSYPNSSNMTLKGININIPVKSKVGIIGTTGSGKTTLVDIILGLLETTEGNLDFDGIQITKDNLSSWQRSIGYVQQNIYLSDDTIASNIAFGINKKDIVQGQVEKVSKIANLHKFIMEELPNKYQTIVGERGIRLSGGQRQRIGIARSLYKKPQLLIFDEATSALDNQTEQVVMEAINNIGQDMTIIIIAHRLNTLKQCDKIFLIHKGKLEKEGTYEEIININNELNIIRNNKN